MLLIVHIKEWHVVVESNDASTGVNSAVSVARLFCMAGMTMQYEHPQACRMQIGFAGPW
jgi:hypothetical protein